MLQPLITLTTDFGWQDHYVGTMKGVLLSRCPGAQLVDITHGLPKFSLHAGAYALAQAAPYFPKGTVHLAVIDPGVGTERRVLVAEVDGQLFVAPDNGVLSLVLKAGASVREARRHDLWLANASTTFHGRDVFAPIAAAIASGAVASEAIGPVITDAVRLGNLEPRESAPGTWRGVILSVDRFGNAITNFPASTLAERKQFTLRAGEAEIQELRTTFAGAPADAAFVYAGSSGYLELGINQGDAAQRYSLEAGGAVDLRVLL